MSLASADAAALSVTPARSMPRRNECNLKHVPLPGTPAGSEIARGERASLERSHQSARALPSHSSGLTRACVRACSWKPCPLPQPDGRLGKRRWILEPRKRFVQMDAEAATRACHTRPTRNPTRVVAPAVHVLFFCFVFFTVQTQPTSLTCSHLSIPACRLFT